MNNLNKFFNITCSMCGLCDSLVDKKGIDEDQVRMEAYNTNTFKEICPSVGIDRSKLNIDANKYHPLIGSYSNVYTGFSNDNKQRLSSSSGGVITEVLCYLLEEKIVDYICLPLPDYSSEISHSYKLSNRIDDIRKSAQSIYTKIPAWGAVDKIKAIDGSVAFVGLPDQVSCVKALKTFNKDLENKVKVMVGPMVGIGMDKGVIKVIPKLAKNTSGIKKLRWRAGEWPGYLKVEFGNGEVLRLHKFYYNYMLPFYCSHESLLSDDFSNECADISVGDAWSPKYEKLGKGWSVVWSKTPVGESILNSMLQKKIITLKEISSSEAVSMHEHMLDFKKRGSKYRAKIYSFFGIPVPKYFSSKPRYVFIRYFIELVIVGVIWICRTKFSRFLLPRINQKFMGMLFTNLRVFWKRITKSIKRKGLNNYGNK